MQRLSATIQVSTVALDAGRTTVFVFTAALVAQTFHMVEHVAQIYQHAILGLSVRDSHGILFFLDLEWNHFVFNSLYFGLLAFVFFQCKFYRTNGPAGEKRFACYAFLAGLSIQSYHVFEHSVRIIQFLQTGCTPCPGILGRFFDGVYLHGMFNTVVYVLPLLAFISYGFHWKALRVIYPPKKLKS